jgi:amino acid permease
MYFHFCFGYYDSIGGGVLALPAGVAAMGDTPAALIPATSMMTVLGVLSAYSFHIIGRLCSVERFTSLTQAWEKIFSRKSSWVVTMACFIFPFGASVSYSIALGDLLSSLAKSAGLSVSHNQLEVQCYRHVHLFNHSGNVNVCHCIQ